MAYLPLWRSARLADAAVPSLPCIPACGSIRLDLASSLTRHACISSGGWGHGEKKFRKQHESPEAWQRFSAMLEEGRRRKKAGETIMVPRYDIVPIPPALQGYVAPGSIMEFPFDVVDSMYTFRANDVVGKISPRPLLRLQMSMN